MTATKGVRSLKIFTGVAIIGIVLVNCQSDQTGNQGVPHWSLNPKYRVYAAQFMSAIRQLRKQIDGRKTYNPGADLRAEFGPLLAERKNVIQEGKDRLTVFAEIMDHVLCEYEQIEKEVNASAGTDRP